MPTKKMALWCYVNTEEHAIISANAERAGLSRSTYIKRVCLGQPTPSLEKQHARRDLLKVNADLGRLGGLFKLCLTDNAASTQALHSEVRHMLKQIEARQRELKAAIARI
ncbi:MAG: pirin [Desulfovibrio sp.]|nr:pirin [Desulfovibrio sp.]MBI4960197.1 pirin [Desulfovibrio sp.]